MKNLKILFVTLLLVILSSLTLADIRDEHYLYGVNSDNTLTIVGRIAADTSTEVVISEMVEGMYVTNIGKGVLPARLTKVTLPKSLLILDEISLRGLAITEIFLPKSIKFIDKTAFAGCEKLHTIIIESGSKIEFNGNPFIRLYALKNVVDENGKVCGNEDIYFHNNTVLAARAHIVDVAVESEYTKRLSTDEVERILKDHKEYNLPTTTRMWSEHIVIPESINGEEVKAIGSNAFYGVYDTKQIIIPETVETIGEGAFNYCRDLLEIKVPSKIKTIAPYFCATSRKLTKVTLPKGVTAISEFAFVGCDALDDIILPKTVRTIGKSAFENCTSLKSITIPKSVTTIEDNAFSGCSSLENIVIPSTVEHCHAPCYLYHFPC